MEIYIPFVAKTNKNIWFEEKNAIDFWVIAKLPNQSDLGDRSNWRWVSLLSIASNVIAIILVHRISIEYVETLNGVQPSGIKENLLLKSIFAAWTWSPYSSQNLKKSILNLYWNYWIYIFPESDWHALLTESMWTFVKFHDAQINIHTMKPFLKNICFAFR